MGKYDELVERLKAQAESASRASIALAEAKSARQGDNPEGALDLYEWLLPAETIEWQAAAAITTLEAELEKLRPQVKVADDQWDAKCDELAAMKARGDRLAEALITLSELSSYLGAGAGDDTTTVEQFNQRIRWGIDHIGVSYRNRAAQVVEECSKKFGTTWGQVKRAILEDTCLEPATLIRDEARDPEIEEAADRITTLEAELAEAQQQVKGALIMHEALSEKLEITQDELAAMKQKRLCDHGRLLFRDDVERHCANPDICFEYGGTVRCSPCAIKQADAEGIETLDIERVYLPEVARLNRELAAMKARGDRLAGFAKHDSDCVLGIPKAIRSRSSIQEECTCGLTQALTEWRDQ